MSTKSDLSIQHPPLPYVAIRPEYMAICGEQGQKAACAAAILNYFEHWHDVKLANREQAMTENKIAAKHDLPATQDTSLWVYESVKELHDKLLGLFSRNQIIEALDALVEYGYLKKRTNPKYKWDRTMQYLFQAATVQTAINTAIPVLTVDYPTQDNRESLPGQAIPDHSHDHSDHALDSSSQEDHSANRICAAGESEPTEQETPHSSSKSGTDRHHNGNTAPDSVRDSDPDHQYDSQPRAKKARPPSEASQAFVNAVHLHLFGGDEAHCERAHSIALGYILPYERERTGKHRVEFTDLAEDVEYFADWHACQHPKSHGLRYAETWAERWQQWREAGSPWA